ncbi:uncharacterized protein PHACADRAFT_261257 [Phanerochaete carnosa HHB-10118-sp]|uniref:Uncharacterized protein n=1 Tax=Phanerochaete carnosa (strain HHB-10118-sp) TaxID=650164 RepID=K5URZ3_PHACS|nr:uncharacterized protein PHACADRAFT_261257 [Phanerochaete carnosa HHB-10118-sp]EKM52671.1 hypothetical protein PHACADRAFT_261257 [Phanerochaete carnosa HHB-10118-sp]
MACDHLAYMRAAPEMEQYCQNDPAEWYKRLTSHLASPMYKIDLKAKIKAGIEPLRDTLSDLFTKLSILHDAAHGQDLKPRPQEVMVDLCTRVGIPALDELDLNDEAKEEIRNLFESIEQMARQDTHFDFQVYLYGMLEAAVRFDFAAVFLNATDGMDILNGLGAILARTIGILELPWIRDKLIEAEMAKFVKGVGERLGRMYGLWN